MQTHVVIELEEGALNLVVAQRGRRAFEVTTSLRLPAPDLGREPLTNLLRTLDRDLLQGATGVHVVLGDRRMQHFVSAVPRLPAADVAAFVAREALRFTGTQAAADAMVATQLLSTQANGKLVMGTTALARSVFEPIRLAFEAAGLKVLGLYSMEACLALAAKVSAGRVALLECNAGRARFVLCDAGCPVQVRRFLVGNAENNPEALAAQLAMELPRTLDWLRETGQQLPETLVLGSRVELDAAAQAGLRIAPLQTIVRGKAPVVLADGVAPPSLGVSMLLSQLGSGRELPSLLDAPRVQLPWSTKRWAAMAAGLTAGLACSWSGVVDCGNMMVARSAVETARADGRSLAEDADAAAGASPSAATAPGANSDAERLQTALAMRRPTSKLLAQVSNAAEAGLFLEQLEFASTERVVVTGFVGGRSRQQALATLAVFSKRLRELPYLLAEGQDEVGEVVGQRNRYHFRLGFAWRNS